MKKIIRHVKGTGVYECVQFGANPNNNLDLVNLDVDSSGDCWAFVDMHSLSVI